MYRCLFWRQLTITLRRFQPVKRYKFNCSLLAELFTIVTARQRSCGKVMFHTCLSVLSVSQSVQGEVFIGPHCTGTPPPAPWPPTHGCQTWDPRPCPPPLLVTSWDLFNLWRHRGMYGGQAGSTYPTGMLSFSQCF